MVDRSKVTWKHSHGMRTQGDQVSLRIPRFLLTVGASRSYRKRQQCYRSREPVCAKSSGSLLTFLSIVFGPLGNMLITSSLASCVVFWVGTSTKVHGPDLSLRIPHGRAMESSLDIYGSTTILKSKRAPCRWHPANRENVLMEHR